jgi:SAM-dependent methyltransferase
VSVAAAPPQGAVQPEHAGYWVEVAGAALTNGGQNLWRRYCDGVYAELAGEWLGDASFRRALKTDLFDEAVGDGLFGSQLDRVAEAHGVDVSARAVQAAQARYPGLRARVADVRSLEYPDEHFDLVLSNSTLDHFPERADIDAALAELNRVLEPGGRLLVSLDNLANPVIALRSFLPHRLLEALRLSPFYVGATLTPGGLRKRLERAGFEIRESRIIMHAPRLPAILVCRALERRAGGRAAARFLAVLRGAEGLSRRRSRAWTGYYVAVLAEKPTRAPSLASGR